MKRILLLFSILMLSCIALWAHDVEIDGIYYNLNETQKTAEVTYRGDDYNDYYEYRGSVTIPETITYNSEIYTVTSIGDRAFEDCWNLTSVTIPNSVTYIGSYAFYDCSGLTSVTIGNSVTSIGSGAFSGCSGLTSVIWNAKNCEDFEYIYYNDYNAEYTSPFYNIRSNITSFTFGNEVKHIPAYLCYEMSKLTEITIPNSVMSIGDRAFEDCWNLTSVTIPNSVTSIGSYAFENCWELTSVTIPNSVTSIGDHAFYDCRGLTSVTIGNSVTSIGWSTFDGCRGLTSVTIPNSVTYIGQYAFDGCRGLTSVTIPNSVTYIGSYAFSGCSGLTSVIWNAKNCADFEAYYERPFDNTSYITSFTFGNEVEHIPAYLCYRMSQLREITIPNSVTSIGDSAFYNTGTYTDKSNWDNGVLYIDNCLIKAKSGVVKGSYTIKEGTRVIGDRAFDGCSGLTSITIPNSVTSIGQYAFKRCSGLTSVIWNAKNYKDCSSSTYSPFYDIRSSLTSFTFGNEIEHIPAYICYGMSKLSEVTIPNSVTSIGSSAFYSCSGLTSITIPNNVTSIGDNAFYGCSGLTSVTIPNSVTSIGDHAFYKCSGLTSVTIPNSVTSIGKYAFSGCNKLRKVTAYPTTAPNAYENSFAHYNAYLYVPCDVYEDYDLDDVFGNFQYIKCIAGEEDEPTSITETLADANITVSGGTISAEADFSIYNTIGQDVTAFNGSLQPGVYLVSIENNIVKVMVH